MDLKIPQIKIDLHDDASEDGNNEVVIPKPRIRALSSPDLISYDFDLWQTRRNKMNKAKSFNEEFLSRESKKESSDPITKGETLERVERTSRKETKITKSKNSEGTSQDKRLPKHQSFPTLNVTSKRSNRMDAIVSPLLLRKFNMPWGMPKSVEPQKGAKNLIESTRIKGAKSPRLPKIKSVWSSLDDMTDHFPNQSSPSLLRGEMTDVHGARKLQKDEEEFNAINWRMSNSLTLLDDHGREIVDTFHKPSMHWQIAKNHVTSKKMKLPDAVKLYRNTANENQTLGNRTMSDHLERESIRTKTSCPRMKKTKDLFAHKDGSEEILSNQNVSLERRLEAIEIKHGIMHQNLEQNHK